MLEREKGFLKLIWRLHTFKSMFAYIDNNQSKTMSERAKVKTQKSLPGTVADGEDTFFNQRFYDELLHILGLDEDKTTGKTLRKPSERRDPGSLIENTILILETEAIPERLDFMSRYGITNEEREFALALELSFIWLGRLFFLKYLETQLFHFHKEERYKFLRKEVINDFDELYKLFHQVVAVPYEKRPPVVAAKFGHLPFLGSSLFDITEIESETIKVNSLDDNTPIKIFKNTALKDGTGKKRTGTLPALYYLFEFFNAYDFSLVDTGEQAGHEKFKISTTALGTVLQKLVGKKLPIPDSALHYCCGELVRNTVLDKFNETYNWKCKTLSDLKKELALRKTEREILEFNAIMNGVTFCDLTANCGEQLISALHELVVVKSELGILADMRGSLLGGYGIKKEMGELIVTAENGKRIFHYYPPQTPKLSDISFDLQRTVTVHSEQRVQEALFHEKRKLMKHALFGVDSNISAVRFAHLRLWLELQKHNYYTEESGYYHLKTLPNIDINVKTGNALVHRFSLAVDMKEGLKNSRYGLEEYKNFVESYKSTSVKIEKNNYKRFIEDIKNGILQELKSNDERKKQVAELVVELKRMREMVAQKTADDLKVMNKLEKEIKELRTELEADAYNPLYTNAFEWRYEFPEVLDDEAAFIGFDIVVATPSHPGDLTASELSYLQEKYKQKEKRKFSLFQGYRQLAENLTRRYGCLTVFNDSADELIAKRSLFKNDHLELFSCSQEEDKVKVVSIKTF